MSPQQESNALKSSKMLKKPDSSWSIGKMTANLYTTTTSIQIVKRMMIPLEIKRARIRTTWQDSRTASLTFILKGWFTLTEAEAIAAILEWWRWIQFPRLSTNPTTNTRTSQATKKQAFWTNPFCNPYWTKSKKRSARIEKYPLPCSTKTP